MEEAGTAYISMSSEAHSVCMYLFSDRILCSFSLSSHDAGFEVSERSVMESDEVVADWDSGSVISKSGVSSSFEAGDSSDFTSLFISSLLLSDFALVLLSIGSEFFDNPFFFPLNTYQHPLDA